MVRGGGMRAGRMVLVREEGRKDYEERKEGRGLVGEGFFFF